MDTATVETYMTTPVLTVDRGTPVEDVAGAMLRKGINSIVCLEAGCEPAGILTSTDFVAMVSSQGPETMGTVGEHMTTDVVTVRPDAPMDGAAATMVEHDVAHLPVFDGDNVTGIVTATDIVRFLGASDPGE